MVLPRLYVDRFRDLTPLADLSRDIAPSVPRSAEGEADDPETDEPAGRPGHPAV